LRTIQHRPDGEVILAVAILVAANQTWERAVMTEKIVPSVQSMAFGIAAMVLSTSVLEATIKRGKTKPDRQHSIHAGV
jgi:hypothetical protein